MSTSEERPGLHDFDFLYGTWHVHHHRLKHRLVGSRDWEEFSSASRAFPMMDGVVNLDETRLPDGQWVGMTLRLYQAASSRWSIYWVNPRDGELQAPVHGHFEGPVGTFLGEELHGGQRVLCRFIWSATDTLNPRWEQALSSDGGQTWETNWIMEHTRL